MSTNTFLNGMKAATNYTYTENGAITHRSTLNPLMDLFAMGAAYRSRSDEDCITLFKKAFAADPAYALKCLFYIGDCRGGQGERRFFRVCAKWLASYDTEAARRNLIHIPEYRRWDDMFIFLDTPLEKEALDIVKHQLALDVQCKTPSLLAKWMPSENTSSQKTRIMATKVRKYLGMTPKQYRRILSELRRRINVLERLMSEKRWDEIEFDKIPSKAGLKYKNAFARHDIERMKSEKEGIKSYEDFAKDKTTKVNAEVLNPVDIADKVFKSNGYYTSFSSLSNVDRLMLDKYWANLKDYYHGREENGIAICDVSGSMWGQPLNAAVSMSAYIAERGKGPFRNHFITFSGSPELVEFEGTDITDKFIRASKADWGGNTNVEAALDLMLNVAVKNNMAQNDIPKTLYIFSDMEFDGCMTYGPAVWGRWSEGKYVSDPETLFEKIAKRWEAHGYKMPRVIFWNLNARQDNIPALNGRFGYVSGFNMTMVETILSGKDGLDLVLEKLNSERYKVIC